MTCKCCERKGGVYDLACVDCCARVVMTTHPSKPRASAMLAAIIRQPKAPDRDKIIARVMELIADGPRNDLKAPSGARNG